LVKKNIKKLNIFNKIKKLQFIISYKNRKLKPNNFLTERTIFVHKTKKIVNWIFFLYHAEGYNTSLEVLS